MRRMMIMVVVVVMLLCSVESSFCSEKNMTDETIVTMMTILLEKREIQLKNKQIYEEEEEEKRKEDAEYERIRKGRNVQIHGATGGVRLPRQHIAEPGFFIMRGLGFKPDKEYLLKAATWKKTTEEIKKDLIDIASKSINPFINILHNNLKQENRILAAEIIISLDVNQAISELINVYNRESINGDQIVRLCVESSGYRV